MNLGRFYQIIGFFCVFCVFYYVKSECRNLKYRKVPLVVLLVTFFFVLIGYKNLQLPYLTYLFIGGVGVPAILYGVLYDANLLLIVAAVYVPFNLLLPADFGGIQRALNGTNIVLVALFLGMFLERHHSQNYPVSKSPALLLVLAYAVFSLISYFRGSLYFGMPYFNVFIFPLKRWLTPMILFVLFYKQIKDKAIIKVIFSVFLIIVIMNVYFGLLEWVNLGFATYAGFKRRLGGINMHPNFLGAFIAYYLCLIAGPLLTSYQKTRAKFLLFPFLLGLRILIPTNSRGAWLGIPPAVLTMSFFRSKIFFFFVLAVFTLPFIFPFLMPDTVRYRFKAAMTFEEPTGIYWREISALEFIGETKSISMKTRYELLMGGIKMARAYPWFGSGWGTFPYLIGNYTETELSGTAHNMFLRILCEMGFTTLTALLVMLFLLFKAAFYIYRREKDPMLKGMALGYMASIPAIIACNLTGNRFDSVDVIVIFWMLSACVLRLKDFIKQEQFQQL